MRGANAAGGALEVGGVAGNVTLDENGYTMVYDILRLINFAHGDIFMFGGNGSITGSVIGWINRNRAALH